MCASMLYAEMMARRSTTAAGNAAMCLFPIVSGLGYESLGGNGGDLPPSAPEVETVVFNRWTFCVQQEPVTGCRNTSCSTLIFGMVLGEPPCPKSNRDDGGIAASSATSTLAEANASSSSLQ